MLCITCMSYWTLLLPFPFTFLHKCDTKLISLCLPTIVYFDFTWLLCLSCFKNTLTSFVKKSNAEGGGRGSLVVLRLNLKIWVKCRKRVTRGGGELHYVFYEWPFGLFTHTQKHSYRFAAVRATTSYYTEEVTREVSTWHFNGWVREWGTLCELGGG